MVTFIQANIVHQIKNMTSLGKNVEEWGFLLDITNLKTLKIMQSPKL